MKPPDGSQKPGYRSFEAGTQGWEIKTEVLEIETHCFLRVLRLVIRVFIVVIKVLIVMIEVLKVPTTVLKVWNETLTYGKGVLVRSVKILESGSTLSKRARCQQPFTDLLVCPVSIQSGSSSAFVLTEFRFLINTQKRQPLCLILGRLYELENVSEKLDICRGRRLLFSQTKHLAMKSSGNSCTTYPPQNHSISP